MKSELIYSGEAARLLDLDPQAVKQQLLGWKVKPVRLEKDPATGRRSTLWRKRDVLEVIKPKLKRAGKVVKIAKLHGGGHGDGQIPFVGMDPGSKQGEGGSYPLARPHIHVLQELSDSG